MATLGTAWSKLRWSIAQRGIAGTMRIALGRRLRSNTGPEKPQRHPFDLQHNVDTSGLIVGGDLRSGHRNDLYNTAYYAIPPSRFRSIIDIWIANNTHPTVADYTFIDIGCGKGRAVMMASEYPFSQAIGVELHSSLAQIATKNLTIWQTTHGPFCPAQIRCQDASEFSFPSGPCLLYLFNPFTAPVMEQLIASIQTQFNHRTGMLDLIYFNPERESLFLAHKGFKELWRGVAPISDQDAAADLVASKEDICCIFRWVGIAQASSPSF